VNFSWLTQSLKLTQGFGIPCESYMCAYSNQTQTHGVENLTDKTNQIMIQTHVKQIHWSYFGLKLFFLLLRPRKMSFVFC